ncbi:hypothetical protein SAMN05444161_3568 [Rhizobiales bacterium GAS191]|nr:hypothetical protein SAMN05444161_3568 [Rhizobiales bacterium GAS191]
MKKISKAKIIKAPKADAPTVETKERSVSALKRTRQMLCVNPALSKDELIAALDKEGLKLTPTTVSSIRSDFIACTRILQDAGLLKRKLI